MDKNDNPDLGYQSTCYIGGCYLPPTVKEVGMREDKAMCRFHVSAGPGEVGTITKRLKEHKPLFDLLADLKRLTIVECSTMVPEQVPGYPATKPLDGENIFKWILRVNLITRGLILDKLPGNNRVMGGAGPLATFKTLVRKAFGRSA